MQICNLWEQIRMTPKCAYFFIVLIFSFWTALPAHSEPTKEDRLRNDRMNQCIGLLRSQDSALRNNWRGHCGEDELAAELGISAEPPIGPEPAGEAINSDALEGTSCTEPLSYTPVASTSLCGFGSKNIRPHVSERAIVRIPLPGGKCARFIPLLLTNKTDFACNAVQSRIACVDAKYDRATDTTSVVLSTRRTGNAESVRIAIKASDLRPDTQISDLFKHPQFVVLPTTVRASNVIAKVAASLAAEKTACIESKRSAGYCETRNVAKADALVQEWARRYRNPRNQSPKPAMLADARALVQFLRARGIDQQLEAWLLFRSIAQNEVGLVISGSDILVFDPILGVSDAVLSNSGLSFGAHQIDLGANSGPEVKLFWDVISAYMARNNDAELERARTQQSCINLPLRLETVAALDLTYRAAPSMTKALRSDEGKNEYNTRLAAYLQEEVRKINALPGLFEKA